MLSMYHAIKQKSLLTLITIINVSNRAIEETAGMIMEHVLKNKERRF